MRYLYAALILAAAPTVGYITARMIGFDSFADPLYWLHFAYVMAGSWYCGYRAARVLSRP